LADASSATLDPSFPGLVCRVQLHLALVTDLDPRRNTSACYLYVDDTEAVMSRTVPGG